MKTEDVKEMEETKQFKEKQRKYRIIILIAFIMMVVIGVAYMNQVDNYIKELEFKSIGAKVEYDGEYNITISFNNNTTQCNAKVIGIDHIGSELEIRGSNLCSETITFNLQDMMEGEMKIWIELERVGEGIREKKQLIWD